MTKVAWIKDEKVFRIRDAAAEKAPSWVSVVPIPDGITPKIGWSYTQDNGFAATTSPSDD
jgi:hypothetical protein